MNRIHARLSYPHLTCSHLVSNKIGIDAMKSCQTSVAEFVRYAQTTPLREILKQTIHVFFVSFDTKGAGGRGGVSGVKKNKCFFLQTKCSFFLQKPYRIILGPQKHVLHLVWSVLGISTAIKTALKVAPTGSSKWSINGKVKHYN